MKRLMIRGIFKIRKLVVVTNQFMNEFKSERIMRKIGYFLFATALMTLGSCSDDTVVEEKHVTPAEVGEEIRFGSSLEKAGSRTIYDDVPVGGAYRVSWVEGDQVAIYCPQAANGTLVNYAITPDQDDPTASELVTKVNQDEAGLQWGQQDEHYFYAFYPADRVKGTEDGKIRGHVPPTQNVTSWNQVTENGGTTWYGKTNTEENAYMWAYGHFKRSEMGEATIPLTFHPWMTVLEIVIQGPKEGTKTVTNVNIRAIEGTQNVLTGDFICDMTPVEADGANGIPNYVPVSGQGAVKNTISISGYNPTTDDFITLGSNDKMVVRAYLLPIDEKNATNARNIQISVATLNGAALTRTLGYSGHGENSIQPHKVNRVTLPRLQTMGTNYWMSSLDKDIYLSELSIPGSKFSYNTSANSAKPVYQGADIKTQFMDGVRAFIAPVDVKGVTYNGTRTGEWWNPTYSHEYVVSSTPGSPLKINGISGNTTLVNTIEDIAEGLQKSEDDLGAAAHECAVVMITKPGSVSASDVNFTGDWESSWDDSRFNTVGGDNTVWIEAVANELQALSKDASKRIYTGEITANTTLEDVRGKIILKINYNDVSQEAVFASSARYPMLFSRWDGLTKTVPLYWGTMAQAASLKWMYHESTHVGSAGEAGIPNTAAIKLSNVNAIFTNSIDAYLGNDAHDTWYMNDCGGVFSGDVTGTNDYDGTYSVNNDAVIALTRWMNREVRQTLQKRTENASTGLVFFNFADKQAGSGVLYETNELIQTIIDNNFKFNLRKEGSRTNTTSYDAAYSKGGNVWD